MTVQELNARLAALTKGRQFWQEKAELAHSRTMQYDGAIQELQHWLKTLDGVKEEEKSDDAGN